MSKISFSQRGRMGAAAQHAKYDARETTAAARAAFLAKFEQQVDPEGQLEPAERARRAKYARRAHFARLALKSVKSRHAKKQNGGTQEEGML